MSRKARKFEGGDVAFIFQADNDGVAINAHSVIQRDGKREFLQETQGHHRTEGKAVFVEIA